MLRLIDRALRIGACLLVLAAMPQVPARAASFPTPAYVTPIYKWPRATPGGVESLIRDSAGNFYGVAGAGEKDGVDKCNSIFELSPVGGVWQKTTLYSFSKTDGCNTVTTLTRDASGKLYGANEPGAGSGAYIFKLSPPVAPSTAWTETIIFQNPDFDNYYSGVSDLYMDSGGVIYGTTFRDGLGPKESTLNGSFFQLTPPGAGQSQWTETTLLKFRTVNALPMNGVVKGADGAFYGLSYDKGPGAVYRIANAGGTWSFAVIHRFSSSNVQFYCCGLTGPLLAMPSGQIYGAAAYLDGGEDGEVFSLTPPAAGTTAWRYSQIYILASNGEPEGLGLVNPLIVDAKGALYGVTQGGLSQNPLPHDLNVGSVIKFTPPTPPKTLWNSEILGVFRNGFGVYPTAGLILDQSGNLFGGMTCTTAMPFHTYEAGCQSGGGGVYEIPASIAGK